MKPYPWRERLRFATLRSITRRAHSLSTILTVIAAVLSLGVTLLVHLWGVQRFSARNDSWAQRGLLTMLAGGLLIAAIGRPSWWFHQVDTIATWISDKDGSFPIGAVVLLYVITLGIPLVIEGLALILTSWDTEYAGERFKDRTLPTRAMRKRAERNSDTLAQQGRSAPGTLAFGVIVDDPIPWRTPRHGMIVARLLDALGHGVILGASRSGKTELAFNLVGQFADEDHAVAYIDYKASRKTYESIRAAARRAGRAFYSFDLGIGSGEKTWYDPLAWRGQPSDKASMLVNSFVFSETGDAAFYRGQAEAWLTLQFMVLDYVGLHEGESTFDYLLRTCTHNGLKERIREYVASTDQERERVSQWQAQIAAIDQKNLASLNSNLSTVINAGGDRLRPVGGQEAVSFAKIAEEGGVIYIGLSASTNDVALKAIGSLVLRDIGVLSGARMAGDSVSGLRPIQVFVDEASRMGARAAVLDNLFTGSLEALVAIWVISQSLVSWPESTQAEIMGNAHTIVAFRIEEATTVRTIEAPLGVIPALQETSEETTTHRAFQGHVSASAGESRQQITEMPFFGGAPYSLTSIPPYHAYVRFTGTARSATIEPWESRRLRKPDHIPHDFPLVRCIQRAVIDSASGEGTWTLEPTPDAPPATIAPAPAPTAPATTTASGTDAPSAAIPAVLVAEEDGPPAPMFYRPTGPARVPVSAPAEDTTPCPSAPAPAATLPPVLSNVEEDEWADAWADEPPASVEDEESFVPDEHLPTRADTHTPVDEDGGEDWAADRAEEDAPATPVQTVIPPALSQAGPTPAAPEPTAPVPLVNPPVRQPVLPPEASVEPKAPAKKKPRRFD